MEVVSIKPAGNMNENEETTQEQKTLQPESEVADTPVLNASTLSTRKGNSVLTPPPPSAPGEFLKAQSKPVPGQVSDPTGPSTVAPPPASVPTEFLDVQQWKETPVNGPAGLMDDFLKSTSPTWHREFESGIWPLMWEEEEEAEPEKETTSVEIKQPSRIRGVVLARGEEITQVLLPDEGLSDTIPTSGQALILTNRRLIAFRGIEGFRDTHLAKLPEISQSSVRTGQRNWTAILQGIVMMVAGGFLYLVVGYWLAGQISGPNVPVLNIDVAPLIALLIILAGLLVLLQNYFTRPAGAVAFRGAGVEIAFPFRSALDLGQIYDFVEMVRVAQQSAEPEALGNVRPVG